MPMQGWSDLNHQNSFDNLVETILILADVEPLHAVQLATMYGRLSTYERNLHGTLEDYLKEKGCKLRSEKGGMSNG